MDGRLLKELGDYDFVRFIWSDLHGLQRGIYIPKRNVPRFLEHGFYTYIGINGMGPRTQIVVNEDAAASHHGNMVVKARPGTAHALPWAGDNQYKVAGVLCNCFHQNGSPFGVCAQQAAERQIRRLEEKGQNILSGFELEFALIKEKSGEPAFEGTEFLSIAALAEIEKFVLHFDRQMAQAGVVLETLHTEFGNGQMELSTTAQYGIKTADNVFIFKQAAKEIARNNGYQALFVTKPRVDLSNNGAHFTLSIWDKNGKNLFSNSGSKDGLSDMARFWIAGLCEHAAALTAVCAPTVNCYRRYNSDVTPSHNNWGVDDRLAAIRAKAQGHFGACLENRLTSAAANPYLAMAATIAAGLDGVERKLPLREPSQTEKDVSKLPENLAEAIGALRRDAVLTEALGPNLLEWFYNEKEAIEISALDGGKRPDPSAEAIAKELDMYLRI